jgi:hypothetical protein
LAILGERERKARESNPPQCQLRVNPRAASAAQAAHAKKTTFGINNEIKEKTP